MLFIFIPGIIFVLSCLTPLLDKDLNEEGELKSVSKSKVYLLLIISLFICVKVPLIFK